MLTGNLIYDRLVVSPPNSNVVGSATKLIRNYNPMNPHEIHDMEELRTFSTKDVNSVLYKFSNVILKYIMNKTCAFVEDEVAQAFNREIIIGLELNKLHSDNFVRSLGYFIDGGCKIPHLVYQNQRCTYLYIKEVPGPTLEEFIKTASLSQFKRIMAKLLPAYKMAVDKYDFCHYDLHLENIIITTVGSELVPVIIDFGSSHIELDGVHLGENNETSPDKTRYDDRSLWVHDMFKIFGFAWERTNMANAIERIELLHAEKVENYKIEEENLYESRGRPRYDSYLEKEVHYPNETLFEFIDGLTEPHGDIPKEYGDELKRLYVASRYENLEQEKLKLNENAQALSQINQYCRKVLQYFHEDIGIPGSTFLETYANRLNPYWSPSVTPKGEASKLEDFIRYINGL